MLYNKFCVVCGKPFSTHFSTKINCSKACAAQRNKILKIRRVRKPKKLYRCHICGNIFTPSFEGEKHCSDKCRLLSPAFLAAKIIFKLRG